MTRSRRPRARYLGIGLLVVLVLAMVFSTKFLSPEELAAAQPKKFDPKSTAADLFKKAQTSLPEQASPLGQVVPALQADPKAAAAKYKSLSPADGAYVFPVTATGVVTNATADDLQIRVSGVPSETTVLVPLKIAINGTAIRDVMGFKFADAPGQTAFQYVGDELKKLMRAQVDSAVKDPASLKGKTVTVVGAVSLLASGGPPPKAKPVNVQPISIKVAS